MPKSPDSQEGKPESPQPQSAEMQEATRRANEFVQQACAAQSHREECGRDASSAEFNVRRAQDQVARAEEDVKESKEAAKIAALLEQRRVMLAEKRLELAEMNKKSEKAKELLKKAKEVEARLDSQVEEIKEKYKLKWQHE